MSDYSTDSEIDHHHRPRHRHHHHDRLGHPVKLFGHGRSLHSIFGGGKEKSLDFAVADILLWRDRKLSAAILAGLATTWYLIEVAEYHFVTLLCHILLFLMVAIFIWFRIARLINWNPPDMDEIKLRESTCISFFTKVNWILLEFYEISSGEDFRLFILAICSLWAMSVIGTYVSTMNLFFTVVLCLETLPSLYERHQGEVDNLFAEVYQELQSFYGKFEHTVLDKIPKGPVKEKKFY